MTLPPVTVLALLALGAVPPLTAGDRARVAGAVDGFEDRGDAFAALVANARRWTPGLGDAPVRLEVDVDRLLADPAAARGELFLLRGTLQQQTPLEDGIAEWFVRDDAGRPMLVYVCGLPPDHPFRDGGRVALPARFYKRVDARARDGALHGYAAFVGAQPAVAARAGGFGQLWAVVVPVAIMLVVFVALMVYANRRGRPVRRTTPYVTPSGGEPPLPDDPAEALAELRRRARVPGP